LTKSSKNFGPQTYFLNISAISFEKNKEFMTNNSLKNLIQNKNENIDPIWTMMPFSPFDYINGMTLNIIINGHFLTNDLP
jgi:hypothetical protein